MDLFAVLLAILLLWNCGYSDFNQEYLSKDNSRIYQRFLQYFDCDTSYCTENDRRNYVSGVRIHWISGWWVFFFFYSGYGVMVQYELKGQQYLERFFGKRVWKVLKPYLLANVVYLLIDYISGSRYNWEEILKNVISGKIVPFSWFVISIIVLYGIFWLSCILTRSGREILLIVFGLTVYCLMCIKMQSAGSMVCIGICICSGVWILPDQRKN